MENLSPEQLENYNLAVDLAYAANEAYDERQHDALTLGTFVDDNELSSDNLDNLMTLFEVSDSKFESLRKAASLLMPRRTAFEAQAPEVEPLMSEEVRNSMTLEQRLKAAELAPMMADHFKEFGVTSDSLRVVMHESPEGENVFTLVHTGNGIDIGDSTKDFDKARSYKGVMAKKNDELFAVPLGGKTYDARKGMTDAAYDALYEDAKADGVTLPDSKQMSEENEDLWTWTMLTGEPLTAVGDVQIRYVDDGGVRGYVYHPGYVRRGLRVRPAVVIE